MGAYGGPDIITDGLVSAYDAASVRSYSGTGIAWNDLSGDNNDATLYNGVVYTTANYGTMEFGRI